MIELASAQEKVLRAVQQAAPVTVALNDAYGLVLAENIVSQSTRFLLKPDEARAIVDDMERQVSASWYDVARKVGVTERDCGTIASAFAYPGFRLPMRPEAPA